jgi:hypothetical protein
VKNHVIGIPGVDTSKLIAEEPLQVPVPEITDGVEEASTPNIELPGVEDVVDAGVGDPGQAIPEVPVPIPGVPEMKKEQTRDGVSIGNRCPIVNSTKQELNTRSAILSEKNGKASSSKRTKHNNIRFFVTDRIEKKELEEAWRPSRDMVGDFMTKPTQGSLFRKFRDSLMEVQSLPRGLTIDLSTGSGHRSVLGKTDLGFTSLLEFGEFGTDKNLTHHSRIHHKTSKLTLSV